MKIDLSRFAGRFRQETRENLSALDNAVARLDAGFASPDPDREANLLREMMRIAHAIKGAARMLGFVGVHRLCHSLEEMLIAMRDRGQLLPGHIDLIVEARKGIDRLLSLPPEAEGEPPAWLEQTIEGLQKGVLGVFATTFGTPTPPTPPSIEGWDMVPPVATASLAAASETEASTTEWRETTVRVDVDTIDDLLYYGRELTQALDGLRRAQGQVERLRSQLDGRLQAQRLAMNSEIGLSVGEADDLLRLLTITALNLREGIAEVDRNIRQIDSGAVELRMRPIAELFETIPLQVRDLAKSLGKEVDTDFAGETVRFDGRIVELLREPMLHIIRNALDHGIEPPAERTAQGKSPRGRLTIGAFESAGWARVVIADDGRGVEPNAILERAAELGLACPAGVSPAVFDLKQTYRFLFNDRFTSRRGATDVSGRGVGLAAVKRRLQELRGDVSVESVPGMGARFTLLMPTSLSSQRMLVAATRIADGRRFVAFPTAMVKETSRQDLAFEQILLGDASPTGAEMVRIFSLAGLLGGRRRPPGRGEDYLVHCSDGLRSAALAVEEVVAETEVVIEPLPHVARSAELIAGAAPLTSEDIVLVINVPSLLTFALSLAD